MTISKNIFCWQGIATHPETGPDFYRAVLGWQVAAESGGPPVFIAPGGAVAHLASLDNAPPSWCAYLSVDDLDASTTLAAKHGGVVVVPPTDLPAGRFSMVTTPSGAAFALYQSAESDELASPGPGSLHWVELHSPAPDADVAWLSAVFGFTSRTQTQPDGETYRVLQADGEDRGGVTRASGERSFFLPWVEVADLDETVANVSSNGGRSLGQPFADDSVGRMAMVSDPSGAVFGVVQPA